MKSLKKVKQKMESKSLTKAQANQVKGGDDKRKGPSGVEISVPGVDSIYVGINF